MSNICEICHTKGQTEKHHFLKTKGAGGNDTDENPDENMVKEAVDVVLTAYGYLALITKGDPNSALDKVIADNVRRGKYDEDTVSAIAHHGNSKVVESLKGVLEELR